MARGFIKHIDRVVIAFAADWLTYFVILYGIWVLTPFAAPVLMQVGATGPAQAIYNLYNLSAINSPSGNLGLSQRATHRQIRAWEGKMSDSCYVEPLPKQVSLDEINEAQMATLSIEGMGCGNCAAQVRNSLLRLDGVVSANIDLARDVAFVDYVPSRTNPEALIRAVAAAGNDGRQEYRASISV